MDTQADTKKTEVEMTDTKARRTDRRFFYPADGITVVAKDRQEADNKLKQALAEKEKDNG